MGTRLCWTLTIMVMLLGVSQASAQLTVLDCSFQTALTCSTSGGETSSLIPNTRWIPGPCSPKNVWNYEIVPPGPNNGGWNDRGYLSERFCAFGTTRVGAPGTTWSAGFAINTAALALPETLYGRARFYFESAPIQARGGGNDVIRTMKYWMWHNDVFDGDQRVIAFIEAGNMCPRASASGHVCFALARNIFSGAQRDPKSGTDVARAACPIRQWCHVQWSWRHGPAGHSFLRLWINNNMEAAPTAQDTRLSATGEWQRDDRGYQTMLLGAVANDGTAFEKDFVIRLMDFQIGGAFDPMWFPGATPEASRAHEK